MPSKFTNIFSNEYKSHYISTLKLSLPVVIAQIGHMIGGIADSIMLGHVSEEQLAASALANSIYILPTLFCLGVLTAITPLISRIVGEGDSHKIKSYLPNAIFIAVILGVASSFVMLKTSFVIGLLHAPQNIVNYAIPFYEVFAYSIIPYTIFIALKQFCEGLQNTKLGMIVILLGNALNIFLNFFLIFGNCGFPRLEIMGAALSTLIARIFMPLLMFILMLREPNIRKHLSIKFSKYLNLKLIKEILKLGVPIGAQFMFEVMSFTFGAIMIGWMGASQLAAHQIALNISALTYLVTSGISTGATIIVSRLIGEKNNRSAIIAANSSLILAIGFMTFAALVLLIFNKELPWLFIQNKDIVKTVSALFIIMAAFQIMDGSQSVLLGILRGMRDVKVPSVVSIAIYWSIELPVGYWLGIVMNLGAVGVWMGYFFGLLLAAIFLFIRYSKIKKTLILSEL